MDSAHLTLLLVSLSLTCCAQFGVQQPRRMVVPEGGTARLSCSLDHQDIQKFNVHWFQQMPGSSPSFILLHNSNSTTRWGDAHFQRFQPMMNIRNNTHFLLITQVTTNDSARYWCMVTKEHFYPVWGNGTYLSVSGGKDVLTPSVTLLSSEESLSRASIFLTMCLVSKFYPAVIEVTWKLDNQTAPGQVTTGPLLPDEDGSYSTTSILEVPSYQWTNFSSASCEVRHDSSLTVISRHLSVCSK
nr:immunoglobulin light chain VJ region [Xenopus laevis]